LCAQRHANADLFCALRDAVGNDAIDADGGKNHGDTGERAEEHRVESRLSECDSYTLFQRFKFGNVNVLVELVDDISESCLQSADLGSGRAQNDIHPTRRVLGMRNVKLGLQLGRKRFMMGTRDDADDFQRRRLVVV